eukprot:12240510-Alexandrium_andersonii.AAC.1
MKGQRTVHAELEGETPLEVLSWGSLQPDEAQTLREWTRGAVRYSASGFPPPLPLDASVQALCA